MKLHVLRFIVVALACASAVVVISNLRAPKAATSEDEFAALYASLGMPVPVQTPATPGTQEKTVAQEGREKNIKILGDLPASQLTPVMNYFASSLGRRCNFCHVNNNGQWDYVADTKPEKNTAREMIKMVQGINKGNFKGNPAVGCFTCHRGSSSPVRVPQLPIAAPTPFAENAGTATTAKETPPTAEQILAKYTEALGGSAAIEK